MENEEFEEADVWGNFNQSKNLEEDVWRNFKQSKNLEDSRSIKESSLVSKRHPSGARMVPKRLPSASEDSRSIHQYSAPQSIPDWSKIYESEEECEMTIPPHEWIARKTGSSFSVCEGAGRTLKGRDLSRVRNAVLTKTGFLESTS